MRRSLGCTAGGSIVALGVLGHNPNTNGGVTVRYIRTVVPPRPTAMVVAYLDDYGRILRGGKSMEETGQAIVQTRNGQFYAQKIMEGGEIVRWRLPGVEGVKTTDGFRNLSVADINESGGVAIPQEVAPTFGQESYNLFEATYRFRRLATDGKLTRKERRSWRKRLYGHWSEVPDKLKMKTNDSQVVFILLAVWIVTRGYFAYVNNKSFFAIDVYNVDETENPNAAEFRWRKFSDNHPEHDFMDLAPVSLSPGMTRFSEAKLELQDVDIVDPHAHFQFMWKVRHLRYYRHWPKDLQD